uniref:SFRICE_030498 n=1 Tax=Spodoptera frugiperda TaxID=7108 RepID=A0A2H1WAJ1_SPOFR
MVGAVAGQPTAAQCVAVSIPAPNNSFSHDTGENPSLGQRLYIKKEKSYILKHHNVPSREKWKRPEVRPEPIPKVAGVLSGKLCAVSCVDCSSNTY